MTFQKTALLSLTLFTTIMSISGADAMRGQDERHASSDPRHASGHRAVQPASRTSPSRARTSDAVAPASRSSASGSAVRSNTQIALDALARATFKADQKAGELDRFALRQGYVILQKLHAKQALSRAPLDIEDVNDLNLRDATVFTKTQADLRAFVAALSDDQAKEFARKFERELAVKAEKLGSTAVVRVLPTPSSVTRTSPTRARPSTASTSESTDVAVPSRSRRTSETVTQTREEKFEELYGPFLSKAEKEEIWPSFQFAEEATKQANKRGASEGQKLAALNASMLVTQQLLDCITTKTPDVVLKWATKIGITSDPADQDFLPLMLRISEILEAKKNAARGETRDGLRSLLRKVQASIKATEKKELEAAEKRAITRSSPTRSRPATASGSSSRAPVTSSTTQRSPARGRPAPVTEVAASHPLAVRYAPDDRIPLWLLKGEDLVWEGKTYTPIFPNRWQNDGSLRFYKGEDGKQYIYSVGLDKKINVDRHTYGTTTDGPPVSLEENNAIVFFDGVDRPLPAASSAAAASRSAATSTSTTLRQPQVESRRSNAQPLVPPSAEESRQAEELYRDMTSRIATTAHSPVMELIRAGKLTPFLKQTAIETMEAIISQQPQNSFLLPAIKAELETIKRAEPQASTAVRPQTSSVSSSHPVTTHSHMVEGKHQPVLRLEPMGGDRFAEMLSSVDQAFAGALETVLKNGTWFNAWMKSTSIARMPGNSGKIAAIRALQYHKGTEEGKKHSKSLDEAIQELMDSLTK